MDGILPLWKPKGPTSHDIVVWLRKQTGVKKIGHTGTLDPGASGVLVVCLGKATRVSEYLLNEPKTYVGKAILGQSTDTEDAEGNLVEEMPAGTITRQELTEAMEKLTGKIKQKAPLYSAVKVRGKKLYDYARKNVPVERPEREVEIYSLELLDSRSVFSGAKISILFRIRASKGTYVRTIAVDLGRLLGVPAHLGELERTALGPFKKEDCFEMEDVEKLFKESPSAFAKILKPLEYVFRSLPKISVSSEEAKKVQNGVLLPQPKDMAAKRMAIYNEEDEFLAIYRQHPKKNGWMKPEKVFASSSRPDRR